MKTEETATQEVDRRKVLQAGAWAAPVLLFAAAAPAAAASSGLVCEARYELMDPRTTTVQHWQDDAAVIEFVRSADGSGFIRVTFIKDYPNATALNVDHAIVKKWDNGAKAGDTFTYPFSSSESCYNPSMIQVDGNNAHWYAHVNAGKGGFQ